MTAKTLVCRYPDCTCKVFDGTQCEPEQMVAIQAPEGAQVPQGPRTEFVLNELRSALNAMLTFFGMDEDENSKEVFDKARQAYNYAEIVMRPLEPWERQSLEDFRACVHRWHEKACAKGYDGVEAMCDTAPPSPAEAPEIGEVTWQQAADAIEDLDDFANMTIGVDASGARETLYRFLEQTKAAMAPKAQPKGAEPAGWVEPELTPESMTDLAVAIGELSQAMGSPCVMGRAPQTLKSQTVRMAAFRLKEAQAPAPAHGGPHLRKQAARLLAQLADNRPRRALDLDATRQLLEAIAAPANADKLIADLTRNAWEWGVSCEIDDVRWGEAGDSHNQMWRDKTAEAGSRLQAALLTASQATAVTHEPMYLVHAGGDAYQAEIVPESGLDDAYLLTQWGSLGDLTAEERADALHHFHDDDAWTHTEVTGKGERLKFSPALEDGWIEVVRLPSHVPVQGKEQA